MIVTVNEQLLFREPSGSYRLALFICPDALRAKQPQCDEDSNVPSNFQPRNRDGPGAFVFVPGGWNVYVETKPPPHHFVETRPTEDLTAIVDPREWKVEELPVISTRVQNDVLALAEHVPVPARSSLYRERHPAEHRYKRKGRPNGRPSV